MAIALLLERFWQQRIFNKTMFLSIFLNLLLVLGSLIVLLAIVFLLLMIGLTIYAVFEARR